MPRKKPPLRVVPDSTEPSRAQAYIETAAQGEALRFIEAFGTIQAWCESPIEELLMAALYSASKISDLRLDFMHGDSPPAQAYYDEAAFVYQQATIGPYRVDILIHDASLPFDLAQPRFMVVECDGHDFHERTKEQARRDKQRDRFLQSKGFKVLRFTGSEIWADPDNCADEIINELAKNDSWRNREK